MRLLGESHKYHLDEYAQHKSQLPGRRLQWLTALREDAIKRFVALGFPTPRDEGWKYTNVAPIEKKRFALPTIRAASAFDASIVAGLALPGTSMLVFVDGRHVPELSSLRPLPAGAAVSSVAAMLETQPEEVEAAMTRATPRASTFTALNTAWMSDGLFVALEAGVELVEPIHVLYLATTPDTATHTRNIIVAGPNSRAAIIEQHAALTDAAYFTNVVTDLTIKRGARIEHHKVQDEGRAAFHIAAVTADVARDGHFVSGSHAFGGVLARVGINVALNGEGAQCTLDGLYMPNSRQHIDHHTRIDHNQPRGTSRELYKGVMAGAGHGVFNGKIVVQPNAQRSDAEQTNRNLLLSDNAEVDTRPQLEIWADDVKCSHGATVGQLDVDQIFYLRSRGVDDASARALLTYGFAAEMAERVSFAALRDRIDALIRARLPQPLEKLA